MNEMPGESLLRKALTPVLTQTLERFKTLFHSPDNGDFIVREFETCAFDVALLYLEGMADTKFVSEAILKPAMFAGGADILPEKRAQFLTRHVLGVAEATLSDLMAELSQAILSGKSVLVVDGCAEGVILETRGYEKRNVGRAQSESVVIGSQQGFVENMRTNITLIRRMVKTPALVSEISTVGKKIPTNLAILYIKGVANARALTEVRRRIRSLNADYVPDAGHLQMLIEDDPMLLVPQLLQTERPDRAAHALRDGQIAIMIDNSPYALIAPITAFHLLHAADDDHMRWQLASFTRIMRLIGLLFSLFLPGLYVALTYYHPHIIPMDLLTSIAETRLLVPFPILIEVLIMEFSFFLINEAGIRMPSQIGSALGIVGALILGQAAVEADLISPILIIIVALSGLGNYVSPIYSLTISTEILRLFILLSAALWGLYGIALIGFLYLCILCGARSFGAPMMAPFAPYRSHNYDLVTRMPLWTQGKKFFMTEDDTWLTPQAPGEAMRGWKGGDHT
ncbi:MAG: spore germination protein [Clostridia bacterium]